MRVILTVLSLLMPAVAAAQDAKPSYVWVLVLNKGSAVLTPGVYQDLDQCRAAAAYAKPHLGPWSARCVPIARATP